MVMGEIVACSFVFSVSNFTRLTQMPPESAAMVKCALILIACHCGEFLLLPECTEVRMQNLSLSMRISNYKA